MISRLEQLFERMMRDLRSVYRDMALHQAVARLDQKLTLLNSKTERLMSALSEWAEKHRASLVTVNEAISGLRVSFDGVAGDVTRMKELIEKLQNTPGPISAEDQKLLDELQAIAGGAATDATAAAAAAKELDERTPLPEPPPA